MHPLDLKSTIDCLIEPLLSVARIPGAAIAVVSGDRTMFAQGYGHCDLSAQQRATADTLFPIASTTKAINATLLGLLVEDGKLEWDGPVQEYLPSFRLEDRYRSPLITVRDLVAMRTGLSGHHFVWFENPITREQLVESLAHLPLSAGLRERFQYSDLTPTIAGHIAEVVTGQSWEELVLTRIFQPLDMSQTQFVRPETGNVTGYYHENAARALVPTRCFDADLIAPAGGSIYSTVRDMAHWLAFNLNDGIVTGRRLMKAETLQEIHAPCMVMGADCTAPSANAAYGLGWFVDTYNGRARISHTGHLHDIHSSVMLFPREKLGLVSFVNFAGPRTATLLNEHVFDALQGLISTQTLATVLEGYEGRVAANVNRCRSVPRTLSTIPSHALDDYAGDYVHRGYGSVGIRCVPDGLMLVRGQMELRLEHWHYDVWIAAPNEMFELHKPHPLDLTSRMVFESSAEGAIAALRIALDPAVPAIRFEKRMNMKSE